MSSYVAMTSQPRLLPAVTFPSLRHPEITVLTGTAISFRWYNFPVSFFTLSHSNFVEIYSLGGRTPEELYGMLELVLIGEWHLCRNPTKQVLNRISTEVITSGEFVAVPNSRLPSTLLFVPDDSVKS